MARNYMIGMIILTMVTKDGVQIVDGIDGHKK